MENDYAINNIPGMDNPPPKKYNDWRDRISDLKQIHNTCEKAESKLNALASTYRDEQGEWELKQEIDRENKERESARNGGQ